MKPNITRIGLVILGLLCLVYTFQPSLASNYSPESSIDDKCTLVIHSGDEDDNSVSANIYVDGTYRGYTDQMSVQVNGGSHTVRAEKSGYGSDEEAVECSNGENVDIFLNLEGQSSEDCTLRVHVRDNDEDAIEANIYVDGTYRGYNDYLTMTVDSGSHDVRASRSGYGSDTNTVTCRNGDMIDTYLNLDSGDECDNGDCNECRFKVYVHDVNGNSIDAKLYLDGDYIGSSDSDYDYKTVDVDGGSHIIWVQKSGYISQDKEADCENGRTQSIYFTLRKTNCDEDNYECQEEAGMKITAINIDPIQPKLGDIVRGQARVKLLDTFYSSVDAVVNVYVDGNLEKSVAVRFNKEDDLEKTVTFAFNTLDYGTGSHNVEVRATFDSKTSKQKKEFSIVQGIAPPIQNCTDVACRIDQKHCLKVSGIQLEKPNVKIGEIAKIDVTVSNCGDFKEDGIAVRLENSIILTSENFSINEGDEQKISFDYEVGGEENLIFTAFDNYYKDSKSFRIKPESGYLSIYLDPSYTIGTRQDNTITFRVKNIGVVSDTFELLVSDNIKPWTYGLANSVMLMPGEERNLQMVINPGSTIGTFDFGITAATALSQKTVTSQLRATEGFGWTGFFAMIGNYGWIPWIIAILLILIILFLIAREIRRRMKGGKRQAEERKTAVRKAEEVTNSRILAMSEEEQESGKTTTREYWWQKESPQHKEYADAEVEGRTSLKRKKFWWDNDCVEYDKALE